MQGRTAKTPAKGKRKPRYSKGFTHAGGLLSGRIAKATGARGFAETRLLTQWTEIVGQSIATITQPVKISHRRNGMGARLIVLVNGANAPEVTMQIPKIVERVNACYGYNAISEVHLTQTAQVGFAEAKTGWNHDQPTPPKELDSQQNAQINASVSGVADETLRQKLEQLGRTIYLKS